MANFLFLHFNKYSTYLQIKKMIDNIDFYIMKVVLVHLNAYDSSSLDKSDCV